MKALAWLQLMEKIGPAVLQVAVDIEEAKQDDDEVDTVEGIKIAMAFISNILLGVRDAEDKSDST